MIHLSTDLGPTPTYKRRELTAIAGIGWHDGRDCTAWLLTSTAKARRIGNRHTREVLSRYAVSEIEEVGFVGRSFVWDKEFPLDEHGDTEGLPQPPYTVRIDQHGEIWCQCMGDKGNTVTTCRHCDATLALIVEGVFGADDSPF